MSSRDAGIRFKREVLLYLLLKGLRVADPLDGKTHLSELVGPANLSDIAGLEPWVIDVRTYQSEARLSTAINDAVASARAAGSDWPCLIMNRRGHPLENAYAVVPLNVLVRIFQGDAPKPSQSSSALLRDD